MADALRDRTTCGFHQCVGGLLDLIHLCIGQSYLEQLMLLERLIDMCEQTGCATLGADDHHRLQAVRLGAEESNLLACQCGGWHAAPHNREARATATPLVGFCIYNGCVRTGHQCGPGGLWLLTILSLSCGKGDETGASSTAAEEPQGTEQPDSTPWEAPGVSQTTTHVHFAEDLDDPEPAWSLEEVSAQLDSVLSRGMPNPVQMEDRYTTLLFDHGDGDCPGGHGDGDDFFHLSCTTEEGYTFEGIALRARNRDVLPGVVVDSWSLSGDFSIGYPSSDHAESTFLRGAGGIASSGTTRDGVLDWFMSWNGSWSDDPTEGWMQEGVSILLEATGGVTADDRRHLVVNGGLAVGEADLYLESVGFDEGSACLGKATGTIWLREPSGYWYTWALGDDCDGCGRVVFSDSLEMGEVCLDLSYFEETAAQVVPGKYTVVVPDTGDISDTGERR